MNKAAEKSTMKQYHDKHRDTMKSKSKHNYEKNKDAIKSKSKQNYEKNKDAAKSRSKQNYEKNKDAMKSKFKLHYEKNKDAIKSKSKQNYEKNKDAAKSRSKQNYEKNKDAMKSKFKLHYEKNKDARKSEFNKYYENNKDDIKLKSKQYYEKNQDALKYKMNQKHEISIKSKLNAHYQKNKDRLCSLKRKDTNKTVTKSKQLIMPTIDPTLNQGKLLLKLDIQRRQKLLLKYYAKNRGYICANERRKYELAELKPLTKLFYVHKIKKNLMRNTGLLSNLIDTFEKEHTCACNKISKGNRKTAISNLAAQRVVCKAIQIRKQYVGALLKAVRYINGLKIKGRADFGEGLHSAHSEPYFYDSAYLFAKRPDILTIDQSGICRQEENVSESTVSSDMSEFENPIHELSRVLDNIDGSCPNYHYSKAVSGQSRELKGHSLLCYMGTECKSRLRILRSAATHYPILRSLIRAVYVAINSLRSVSKLDEALKSGDFAFLMNNLDGDFDSLLSNDVETTHELTETAHSVLRRRDLELHLQITHAGLIAEYQKAVEDYPQNPCCSCQQLHQRRNVTKVNFSNRLGDTVWPALKQLC